MKLEEKLAKVLRGKKVLFLGVGNEMKADDDLGRYVYDSIMTDEKIFCGEMPENYISKIKESSPDAVVMIDAVHFNGKPGEIVFSDIRNMESVNLSTHSLSFSMLAKMLPGIEVYVLGVQPESLEFGKKMSSNVKKAAETIARALNSL